MSSRLWPSQIGQDWNFSVREEAGVMNDGGWVLKPASGKVNTLVTLGPKDNIPNQETAPTRFLNEILLLLLRASNLFKGCGILHSTRSLSSFVVWSVQLSSAPTPLAYSHLNPEENAQMYQVRTRNGNRPYNCLWLLNPECLWRLHSLHPKSCLGEPTWAGSRRVSTAG